MTPSLTLERRAGHADDFDLEHAPSAALSLPAQGGMTYLPPVRGSLLAHAGANLRHVSAVPARSPYALLSYAAARLSDLGRRQGAIRWQPYAIVLRLITAVTDEGSATPQIADNGEGGIEVLWLVDGSSLTVDYEDEFEILLTGAREGDRAFTHLLTAYWTEQDAAIAEARRFLADISTGVRHPIPLD